MIHFFGNQDSKVFAVQTVKELSAENTSKLNWLFGNQPKINAASLDAFFIGPRAAMITPWSTNAVEITQNMGIDGIIRIEETISNTTTNLKDLLNTTVNHNQNISDDIISSIIEPFINLKTSDFFECMKLFDKNNLNLPSEIFLKVLSFYLNQSLNNQKLFRYLIKLHSDFIYDLDESIKFNTLTNDLIAIYFTRLNSNLIKYGK